MKSKVIIGALILILAIAGLIWYSQKDSESPVPILNNQKKAQDSQRAAEPAPETQEAGLGAQAYDKAENPVKDEVPETNPYKEAYVNPFQ